MSRVAVARRYARALVDLADAQAAQVEVRAAMEGLAAILRAVPEAQALLANATVPLETRSRLLGQILDQAGLKGLVASFARVLLEKGRFVAFFEILSEFNDLLDDRTGRVEAGVESAVPLGPGHEARLQAALGRMLGRQVVLRTRVVPELMGGLVVRIGNRVFDASIRNHLERLHERLVGAV